MPCTVCLISQLTVSSPTTTAEDVAADYHRWGWPVTMRRDQLWLSLAPNAVALIIPALLAIEVTAILTAWRCQPAVLTHPNAPTHRVVVAGEWYPVPLPWPTGVNRVTTKLLLPLTLTPSGPLRWVHPLQENSLRLCREIDVLAAVRTTLRRSTLEGEQMAKHNPPKPRPDPSDDGHKPGQLPPPREPGKHERDDPPLRDPRDPR